MNGKRFALFLGIAVLLAGLLLAVGLALYQGFGRSGAGEGGPGDEDDPNVVVIERTVYGNPPPDPAIADDDLDAKRPAFDAALVDSRPLGEWEVNQSGAVIGLDCPAVKPDVEGAMLELRPSYAAAVRAAKEQGLTLLPSSNLLDGAAKQFDDGLYAAIDLACYRGELGLAPAAAEFVQAVFGRLPPGSPARPWLAGALELAGRKASLSPEEGKQKEAILREFDADPARSKPISFYEWTAELQQLWRFFRFLQHEFGEREIAACRAVAAVLEAEPELLRQYRAINGLYARLTNPSICLPVDALIGTQESLETLAKRRGARHPAVAVFPPSTSREAELFEQVFPEGVPAGASLMTTLIQRIRSGEVELEPDKSAGWYQHQVYALETMLLPTRGQESDKLLLTASYKRRLVEAFKALVSKRRETHARQRSGVKSVAEPPPPGPREVNPRLRIEPCPTFYLRTARAYAFVENVLVAAAGRERLAALHGLKQGGSRPMSLADELAAVRLRFYGFYLVSCEDIGMKPQLLADEPVDGQAAKTAALEWLENLRQDADLACDTRVCVPIYVDTIRGKTRVWAVLGVRLAHLEASYARAPKIRPKKGGDWRDADRYQCGISSYAIAVDEFAELELSGSVALSRSDFRALCDRHKTKEAIVEAVSAGVRQ